MQLSLPDGREKRVPKNNDRIEFEEKIVPRRIVTEMEESFLDYAMSVIVSRAIPEARDGMKPIHRRILWSMYESGFTPDKPTAKCAKIIGDVMGNYHPHGDLALYDGLVRLGQEWSLRYPLVTPQGNFGSVDGDPPAAHRYTEAKLSPVAAYLLDDVKKETVDWVPTFDPARLEPVVLPAGLPNLLMNGSEGIAVGMATRIPPHNLTELSAACMKLIDNPFIDIDELIAEVPGPDFPTGAMMLGNEGAVQAYKTGRGTITLRSRTEIEEDDRGRLRIVVSEIPYQVNKSTLIEKIATLAHEKKIQHIRDVRDESDRTGIRIIIELSAQAQAQVILNNLFKHTQLQTNYSMIMLALRDGVPRLLNLKEMLTCFVDHRREVITRRSRFEKRKAEERAHILEGLKIAQDNIDEVVKIIRASKDTVFAKTELMNRFDLSDIQAQAILDMKLSQLTSLEVHKIVEELKALRQRISELEAILADDKKRDAVVKSELAEATAKFGDERRTLLARGDGDGDIDEEELIRKEDVVVTLTRGGYIKRTPANTYRAQGRGGRGMIGAKTKAEDVVKHMVHTNTHDTLLCFTDRGVVHSVRVYKIPAYDRTAKGLPAVNLINLLPGENLTAMISLADFSRPNLILCTLKGTVKRVALKEFSQLRSTGKRAIGLNEDDTLRYVLPTTGHDQVLIFTRKGYAVKFDEEQVRVMGTSAAGVRGVSLQGDDDWVVGMDVATDDEDVLVTGERGLGKRSKVELFRKTNRGAKGVIALKVTDRTGPLVSAGKVVDGDELLIITREGMIIRTEVKNISVQGRATQGVKLINLRENDAVGAIEVIHPEAEDETLFEEDKPEPPAEEE
ncbi:DNA gyrase subunit A [bacterium]|nr:DNA gyrase subunit A [bacterium]